VNNINTILAVGAVAAVCGTSLGAVTTLYSQNFDGMTTSNTAALPANWRFFNGFNPTWGGVAIMTAVSQNAGTSGTGVVSSSSAGGNYLWVDGVLASGTDKAIGFLSSGGAPSPRSIMMSYTNDTGYDLASFTASWDYEKYRSGTRAFDWTFFASTDGTNWSAVSDGNQSYSSDANNATVSNPASSISKSATFSASVANGTTLYLRWTYTGVGGSSNAQGLAIDNFSLVPAPGAAALIGLAGFITTRRRK
jgi:hypothetical protein